MDRIYRFRISLVVFLLALVTAIYAIRLFSLQLTDDDDSTYTSANTTTYSLTVAAARGDILDRHGNVLVSNRASYSVILNSVVLFNADDPNGLLLKLAETCIKNGIEYTENLPLSTTTPYTYDEDKLGYTFKRFLLGREWDADMTAENLAKKLKKTYHISEEYTEEQARLIMGLRYELDLPTYANADTYTLAEDVTADQLAILKELAIPGMDVTTSTVREYNTTFAAQLLGHVSAMYGTQYEDTYEALGYSMDAKVGQDGLEAAFEEYLHGTDGEKIVTMAADGTVLDEYWEVEPQSGSNVITSLDIGLQEVAEKSLASRITALAESRSEGADGYDANAGAVVVMDVNTGEVLAAANYPTYDPSEYYENYNELLAADGNPLANRALNYAYPPGSTFKMITSLAAIRAGVNPGYTVNGTGSYSFSGLTLYCWIWTQNGYGHGTLDMRGAIANSCNIYFYTVGLLAGIDRIDEVATSFGIGEDPGSEIPSNDGQLASEALKKALYGDDTGWYDADTATASIGQSDTEVTPLQLCRYVATLANGGTLYKATFLRRAVSADFQTLVAENDYTPVATDLLTADEYQVIYEGMRQCVTEGTAKALADYDVAVCAKTGTAQHGSSGSDNGAFVCWAPAEDPEIAIAVYVEHGASGSNFAGVARDILDYYFNSQYPAQELELENEMTED
jgi:penicillin-binding protein 2